jgi:hypothetical protein
MGACLVLKLASPGLALPYGHGQQETRLRRRAILPLSIGVKILHRTIVFSFVFDNHCLIIV